MAARVAWPDRHAMIRGVFPRGGIIMEIGVQFGRFAEAILRECRPSRLILVDPWRHIPGPYEADPANVSDEEHERRFLECCERFAGMGEVEIWRGTSQDAIKRVARGWQMKGYERFDAIYLDADHTQGAIWQDLIWWWPRVKRGGILAGHDYVMNEWIQVKEVVDEFAWACGRELLITAEPDFPSWVMVKS